MNGFELYVYVSHAWKRRYRWRFYFFFFFKLTVCLTVPARNLDIWRKNQIDKHLLNNNANELQIVNCIHDCFCFSCSSFSSWKSENGAHKVTDIINKKRDKTTRPTILVPVFPVWAGFLCVVPVLCRSSGDDHDVHSIEAIAKNWFVYQRCTINKNLYKSTKRILVAPTKPG